MSQRECELSEQHAGSEPDVAARRSIVWPQVPQHLALQVSSARRQTAASDLSATARLPEPFCIGVGRRLLLAELTFGDWVSRRVERVSFKRERSVKRRISVEFVVDADAPIFTLADGEHAYLVPVSVLRRKTMVNFGIADENETRLPMIGMRLAQQLDASILLAAAEETEPGSTDNRRLVELIKEFTAGEDAEVAAAMREFTHPPRAGSGPSHDQEPLGDALLAPDSLFQTMIHRLRHNFTLYCLLAVAAGRHRVLTLSFEEPTSWKLQQPKLEDDRTSGRPTPAGKVYQAGGPVSPARRAALLGLTKLGVLPARFRFQVPSAENTASYHFEVNSPQGVRIVRASLLAGRPNEDSPTSSIDQIAGVTPTVGLHAVEIPSQSLCRVQLDLRIPVRGWLTQLVVSCLVIMAVVCFVALHGSQSGAAWTVDQVTNVVVLLVAVSAATATLVSQRDFQGLAATMVTGLRALGVVSLVLPILDAGCLVYAVSPALHGGDKRYLQQLIDAAAWLSAVTFVIPAAALLISARNELSSRERHSPWDMTEDEPSPGSSRRFSEVLTAMRFDSAAYGIESTEGWYSHYSWTQTLQHKAVSGLRQRLAVGASGEGDRCRSLDTVCARSGRCPSQARA